MPLIDEGAPAPEFTLPDQDGREHTLSAYRGRKVILYFYPKDDTPGCTKEACQFRDALPEFEQADAVVLGMSPDPPAKHRKFADKHELPFPLLADEPGEDGMPATIDAFGVWQEKSMYGKTYMGVVRTTYLIDEHGNVARRWDKVRVPGHVDTILESMRDPQNA